MSRMAAICLVLLALACPGQGHAGDISTGQDLHAVCSAKTLFPECVTYLRTVYDAAKARAGLAGARAGVVGSCGPEKGIDTVPLVVALHRAWQEYAARNADRLSRPAAGEALLAFERQWPCQP